MPDAFRHVMRGVVAMALAAVLLAGCGGSGARSSNLVMQATAAASAATGIPEGSHVVTIDNFNFVPPSLTVA